MARSSARAVTSPRRAGRRPFYCALALVVYLAAAGPQTALAHARLVRANPADGAVLSAAPRVIHLWFDEAITGPLSSAQLLDAAGQPVGAVSVRVDPADPTALVVAVPAVPAGVYSLAWRIVSAIDAHRTQGTLVFGVNQAVTDSALSSAARATPISATEAGARAAFYLSLALAIGGLFTAGGLVRPAAQGQPAEQSAALAARRRALTSALAGAGLAFAAGGARLIDQAAALDPDAWPALLAARPGLFWLAQQGLLLITALALVAARRGLRWGWLGAGLALGLVALGLALNSHAAGLAEGAGLAVAVLTLHIGAASLWVGAVLTLALTGRAHDAATRAVTRASLHRLGVFAAASVGLVAATGLFNTARQVASVDAGLTTPYGQTLALKLGLFLVVGLAGLLNSARLHPAVARALAALLRRPAGWTPAARAPLLSGVLAEAFAGLGVLALTGWLAATPPARGPEFEPVDAAVDAPSTLTQPAEDLIISLQIRPNQPGLNFIEVGAFNTRRPAPAETLRVLARLTYTDQDLGTQTVILEPDGDQKYRLSNSSLSVAGRWRIAIVVRRSGLADTVAEFDWRVAPLSARAAARPVLISQQPLAPGLTGLALGVLVVMGVGGLVFGVRRAGAT